MLENIAKSEPKSGVNVDSSGQIVVPKHPNGKETTYVILLNCTMDDFVCHLCNNIIEANKIAEDVARDPQTYIRTAMNVVPTTASDPIQVSILRCLDGIPIEVVWTKEIVESE